MFKVGDKVRCIDAEGTTVVSFGKEYEVAEVDGEYLQVLVDGSERGMYAHRFELVEQPWQPKVGDRVRVIYGHGWNGEGVVSNIAGLSNILVGLETGERAGYTGGFDISKIEPLPVAEQPAALRIVEGRYYKTRDGRKVGPMQSNGPAAPTWQWYGDNYGNFCRDDGTVHYGDGAPHADDLIAEWVDEPAAPVAVAATASNDNAAPAKFKVGDRVRSVAEDATNGLVGVIIRDDESSVPYLIRFDDFSDGHGDKDNEWWLSSEEVESTTVAPQYSTTGFTIPLVDEEKDGSTQLTVRITSDFTELHEQIDYAFERLKKLKKKARKIGIDLQFDKAA